MASDPISPEVVLARTKAARRQLGRLSNLTDCVYAFALLMIMRWLPLPEESTIAAGGGLWIGQLWAEYWVNLVAVGIATFFLITLWLRNNLLSAYLDRTDWAHTTLSIVGLCFALLLIYIVRINSEVAVTSGEIGESVAVALAGFSLAAGWSRARRKGLLDEAVPEGERARVQVEAFTEPITATLTLPFAFVGPLAWNLSWLLFIPVSAWLKRAGRRAGREAESAE